MRLTARERAPIDRLLSGLLAREIDAATWERLQAAPVTDFFERARPGFREWIEGPPTEPRLETLAEEFARLFLLPGEVPPYASVWLDEDREAAGRAITDLARSALAALGREPVVAEPWGRMPLDHAALLLDLVAAASLEALETDADVDAAEPLRAALLDRWLRDFGAALEARAQSPLYAAVGATLVALQSGR